MMLKLALGVEYDGSAYHGWQRQPKIPTIQEHLERALSNIANEPIKTFCAGRTDAGVHATGQVIHFETHAQRTKNAWVAGVNSNLPLDIAVNWMSLVPNTFHARFSAVARRYYYIIYNDYLRTALFKHRFTHYHRPLDINKMIRAGQYLQGENDFTSFRSSECQSFTPWRNIHHLNVIRYGKYIIIDIKANSFVHHMIRNIVGSLITVGCGNKPETWIHELLILRNRALSDTLAPATGLYLTEIDYPSHFKLPVVPLKSFL